MDGCHLDGACLLSMQALGCGDHVELIVHVPGVRLVLRKATTTTEDGIAEGILEGWVCPACGEFNEWPPTLDQVTFPGRS
jgi:hypothetical protein